MRYRKVTFGLVCLAVATTGILGFLRIDHAVRNIQLDKASQAKSQAVASHSSLPAKKTLPKMSLDPAPPRRITVASLGIDTAVMPVGMDSEGDMENPSEQGQAVWYKYGYLPGAIGNTVIAGHYLYHSKPALFYRLKELKAGDMVAVENTHGRTLQFKITDSSPYDPSAPTDVLFGPSDKALLRLVTCHGAWDRAAQQYAERLVVTAEFVQEDAIN